MLAINDAPDILQDVRLEILGNDPDGDGTTIAD